MARLPDTEIEQESPNETAGWRGTTSGPVAFINRIVLGFWQVMNGPSWRNRHRLSHQIFVYEMRVPGGDCLNIMARAMTEAKVWVFRGFLASFRSHRWKMDTKQAGIESELSWHKSGEALPLRLIVVDARELKSNRTPGPGLGKWVRLRRIGDHRSCVPYGNPCTDVSVTHRSNSN